MPLRSNEVPDLAPARITSAAIRRPGRPATREPADAGSRTLTTGIELLKVVAQTAEPANLSVLARRAGMSPSRAYRYLVTLARTGLLHVDRSTGAYSLGPAALELGLAAFARVDALGIGGEVMRDLTAALGLVSHISVWTSNGPTSVRSEQGRLESVLRVREGVNSNLVATSTGRVFLAFSKDTHLAAILRRDLEYWNAGVPARARLTSAKVAAFRKDVRQAGFACVVGMRNAHVTALSAPVFDRDGLAMSLTISGITGSFDASADGDPARSLTAAAAQITYRIGGTSPLSGSPSAAPRPAG